MQVRKVTSDDMPMLHDWWESWGWEHAPGEFILSDDGVIVYEGDTCICAGFLYTVSNASIAWFTFPVSNPAVRGKMRKDGIQMMISEIERIASEMGYLYLYSSLRNSSMIQAQKNNGYIEAGTNHTELLKFIWEQK